MSELAIDISHHRSKSVEQFAGQEFDYVITVCENANQNCPIFPGKTMRVHWSLDDPAVAEGMTMQGSRNFAGCATSYATCFEHYR